MSWISSEPLRSEIFKDHFGELLAVMVFLFAQTTASAVALTAGVCLCCS